MGIKSKSFDASYFGARVMGYGLFGAIIILGYQVYQWLKNGEWLDITLHKGLYYLEIDLTRITAIEWQGVQRFLFWLLEVPLAAVVAVLSIGIGFTLMSNSEL